MGESKEGKVKMSEEKPRECPGNACCLSCTAANSSEESAAEEIAPLFEGLIPATHCCSIGGCGPCCGEE